MAFEEIDVAQLQMNPFTMIGDQWMLVTAGDERGCNTMTASWGGFGVLWGMNAATVYLRPQRYTKEFVDANDRFTLSFLGEEHRKALAYCGKVSGRDQADKLARAGLSPYYVDGTTGIQEADLVLVCRKLYAADMPPENFIAKENDEQWYSQHDYHCMYVAQVERALAKR
ncbi:MAG: hypothetical protein PEGG_00186 [Paraeggerthella hongkongensis]|uniref:flavin reductase family protein n=1 Tax=unclassified Paraeggerthella TaxID=2641972 RepID=UPI001CE3D759|nr:flavin reductase [Paraeggerthella sp. Marseille-Q4926]